jgi:amidohydrolase
MAVVKPEEPPVIRIDHTLPFFPELVTIRREIHQYPELGFRLEKTVKIIETFLQNTGIPFRTGIGHSGIVGLIQGARSWPVVALRADMDALLIQEQNEIDYVSQTKGVMHACGHDLHIACLLGAARLLAAQREKIPGIVKLIFQPAEEIDEGAKAMIVDGVLDKPKVDAIFGLHNYPGLPVGCIAVKPGPLMASLDNFRILIEGKGGHGAVPNQAVDALLVAASIVLQLQTIVSRNISPTKEAVVTIGTFHAGTCDNIIADRAELSGTTRALDSTIREELSEKIRRIVVNGSKALGASGKLEFQKLLPVLVNEDKATDIVSQAASKILGKVSVLPAEVTMGGDDFSLMLERIPGCYFWLGATTPDTDVRGWHSPQFNIDENAIPIGSTVLTQVAIDYLSSKESQISS